ncbi:hypothetical protein [Roseibaca sp. Y0-43]|uniref:hypothetical protein n=1 Tax=Roseibaca sp. Y0-43 TaxID=2816854 RepID=UPI001D0CA737|nr:hypothetical protein [Roseibaca sp. Y0-43]MCC1481019.1 hypothetical protein [Roseibaca sp. Y0-43]
MNRQLVIRGAAISIAAIAASVFLAGEFLGDKETLSAGAISADPAEIRGASVISPVGPGAGPQAAEPALEMSALDVSKDKTTVPNVQDSFQPELTFADQDAVAEPALSLDQDLRITQSGAVETPLCAPDLTAKPAIDGLIELQLSAPCNANERIVLSHGDLAFSATLDMAGEYTGYIPALAADARVDVFLSDDTYLQAQTVIPDHADYARMIVQWTGPAQMGLHAYHRGAAYGEDGHIHAMNPFDPALEEAFLVALGEDEGVEPMLAQVYSVPLAQASETRLQLEVSVNARSCGTDLVAFVMPTHGDGAGVVEELRVAMPDCAVGDGLVILDLPFNPSVPAAQGLEFTSDNS